MKERTRTKRRLIGKVSVGGRLALQLSNAFYFSRAIFPRAGGGRVSKLMLLEQVGQAIGLSRRSFAGQVFPTDEHQGSADLLQGDLWIFPRSCGVCKLAKAIATRHNAK